MFAEFTLDGDEKLEVAVLIEVRDVVDKRE